MSRNQPFFLRHSVTLHLASLDWTKGFCRAKGPAELSHAKVNRRHSAWPECILGLSPTPTGKEGRGCTAQEVPETSVATSGSRAPSRFFSPFLMSSAPTTLV